MTEPFMFVLGAVIIVVVFYDFLRTTIALNGLGPFSGIVSHTLWRVAKRLVPVLEQRFGIALRGAVGPSILIVMTAFWVSLHLLGYTLMFRSGPSLIESDTETPATLVQTTAYAGSAISTLGASTVQVTNGWWDNLSMVAAVNGMVVLTLSVSFILNVLQTTTDARTFARRYNALMSRAANFDRAKQLETITPLGGALCGVVVKLTASPLPSFFSPHDQTMDFPAAIKEICLMLQAEGITPPAESMSSVDLSELRWGVSLLSRREDKNDEQSEVQASMSWADHHILDNHRSLHKGQQ